MNPYVHFSFPLCFIHQSSHVPASPSAPLRRVPQCARNPVSHLGSISFQFERYEANGLRLLIQVSQMTRVYTLQHAQGEISLHNARKQCRYAFSLAESGSVFIYLDVDKLATEPDVTVLAQSADPREENVFTFHSDASAFRCNKDVLKITKVTDLQDSCSHVSLFYGGSGDVYLLGRQKSRDAPDARNIIEEGIFVGTYTLVLSLTQTHRFLFLNDVL